MNGVRLQPSHWRLARRCLAEAARLPDAITRAHFRSVIIRRIRRPHGLTPPRVERRVCKTVHMLEHLRLRMLAARSGQLEVLRQLVADAFGRSGHLRQTLLAPFLVPPPPPTQPPLPYPSCRFPRFSPALQALLMSPVANAHSRPPTSPAALRAFPATITRIWADLPGATPTHEGNLPHMGIVSAERQVNMRRRQWKKWVTQLQAPLGDVWVNGQLAGKLLRSKLGIEMEESMVQWGNDALALLRSCARPLSHPTSRFAPLSESSTTCASSHCSFQVPSSPAPLLPRLIPPTHPLHPNPLPLSCRQLDPLAETLAPKHQPIVPEPLTVQLAKSRGPRPITSRMLQRCYQSLLSSIPVLEYLPSSPKPTHSDASSLAKCSTNMKSHKGNRGESWVVQEEKRVGIDRSWMTPPLAMPGRLRVIAASDLDAPRNIISGEDALWL